MAVLIESAVKYRLPQRSYSARAIEAWFERLQPAWEPQFRADELEWGRDFYRQGEVRATEVMEDSAIVYFRRGKNPLYVVVDWNGKGLGFRISDPAIAPGRALGVAALYELEECVLDELPAIEAPPQPRKVDATPPEPAPPTHLNGSAARDGRGLRVRLHAANDGLRVESGWQGATGEAVNWSSYSIRKLSSWEREQWIGYTALARRSGFRPAEKEGCYRIDDAESIAAFFQQHWPSWRKRYQLVMPAALKPWAQGVKLVRPVIEATASTQSDPQTQFRIHFSDAAGKSLPSLRDELLRHPGKLHLVPGEGLFKIDPGTVETLAEWKAVLPENGTGELPAYHVFSLYGQQDIEIRTTESLANWKQQFQQADADSTLNSRLPDYLRGYQRAGVAWLERLRSAGCHGLLADEMGLGKTLQTLCFLHAVSSLGHKRILVVCPASVLPIWQAEIDAHFAGTPVCILGKDQSLDDAAIDEGTFWLASYTQLRRHRSQLAGVRFAHAVLDEAQNIKNPDAKVTHACLAIRADHRIALTGTPMENRPTDLWTLFRFLMPGLLSSRRRFEDQQRSQPDFNQRLRTRIRPFLLRRLKLAVVSDLPPKVEMVLSCPMSELQRRQYAQLSAEARAEFSGGLRQAAAKRRMHLFSLLTRLRQICCDPALLGTGNPSWTQSGKLVQLVQQIHDPLASGSKVVVFSQFVTFLQRARSAIRDRFPEIPQFVLTGSTRDRNKPVEGFQKSPGSAVFFVSLKAGGTGLNLQVADYLFLLDPWWNPAVEAQAMDRVHRIGQKNRVFIYRLVTPSSIEERIEQMKAAKSSLLGELVPQNAAEFGILDHFKSIEDLLALPGDDGSDAAV